MCKYALYFYTLIQPFSYPRYYAHILFVVNVQQHITLAETSPVVYYYTRLRVEGEEYR